MQLGLFEASLHEEYAAISQGMHDLDAIDDTTLDGVQQKEAYYRELASSEEYITTRLLADAWCAAFVWEKRPGYSFPLSYPMGYSPQPLTDLVYRRLQENPHDPKLTDVRRVVVSLADRYQFFHWHVAFPDVFHVPEDLATTDNKQTGWSGGFDVVLGNPPWERIKIQEKEWFAERDAEIAAAPNAAARRRMIEALADADPHLLAAFQDDKRKAEGESHFVRQSERFPLCGRGDVNTYTIFAETSRHIINGNGRVGIIVPSGIATDDTTKYFFQDLMETRTLASLYDFENREGLFPSVDSRMKFSLLTIAGAGRTVRGGSTFVFFAHNVGDLSDEWRRFRLTAGEIALLNPNTGTMATFRSGRDAEITKRIYRNIPILIEEHDGEDINPWGLRFAAMLHMANDSHLFHTSDELDTEGFTLQGNHFVRRDERYLPLYEAKMIHHFTHRWATYDANGSARDIMVEELQDPSVLVTPRYWVNAQEVYVRLDHWDCNWLVGWRDITNATNERTTISSVAPIAGCGDTFLLMFPYERSMVVGLITGLDSFVSDFVARQKVGGTHMKYHVFRQITALPPYTYTPILHDFIKLHVLELVYTAWDLQPFAQDVGYDGPPFVWNEERRFLMRCELDALYFHLYQIARDDVDYIMETFPIVKRKDIARTADENGEGGEYITKNVILEMYDQMAALPRIEVPHPKGLDEPFWVPDVSQFETWLSPPPADPSVAHEDNRV